MPAPNAGAWVFLEFLKTGDSRYRKIVKRFADAGFVVFEQDDYTVRQQSSLT